MTADDFPAFFRAVHGRDPFPWQTRLAREVALREWPAVLSLPTAAGKTSAVDVAVFALALEAGAPLADRRAPLRVFFVIDRRLVVDQAAEHARKLRASLLDPGGLRAAAADRAVVAAAAAALRRFGGTDPLKVAALRGGVYRDDRWASAPNQPTVCVTTVDQVGSRLLFRGYGVGEFARPVHAGLTGNDALYLLDEAHLSQPFLETLRRVGRLRAAWGDGRLFGPFRVVEISATPATPSDFGEPFELLPDDRMDPELARRLAAPKPATFHAPARFEDEVVGLARAAREDGHPVAGVVVNRVASAREVFRRLPGKPFEDKVLLTGRVRPRDRDLLLGQFLERVRVGRDRGAATPLFVVATMTVEVGADLDFDYLVTEAAPLPALRQRFGRLDRLGRYGRARGAVVLRKAKGDDPVYGPDLVATWDWLQRVAAGPEKVVDFGVDALAEVMSRDGDGCPRPAPVTAPILLPSHLDVLAQTSPEPCPSPDVAPYLHGPDAWAAADVQVIWRADLREDFDDPTWVEVVAAAPPRSREALPLPLRSVLEWLCVGGDTDTADVEGVTGAVEKRPSGRMRPAVCWRGREESFVTRDPSSLRPGDTVVVPSAYGGADEFGWDPGSPATVTDLGDAVVNEMADSAPADGPSRLVRVRVHAGWAGAGTGDEIAGRFSRRLAALRTRLEEGTASDDAAADLGGLLAAAPPPDPLTAAVLREALDTAPRLTPYPAGVVLTARLRPGFAERAMQTDRDEADLDEAATDEGGDDMSLRPAATKPVPVLLTDHIEGVVRWTESFCQWLGLDPLTAEVLARAARLHDLGKADWRFQYLLYGDEPGDEVLAKSGRELDPGLEAAVRNRAGLPDGFRHEFVSVALVRSARSSLLGNLPADKADLVEYLVGTHHGRGRPLPPATPEPDPNRPETTALSWEGHRLSARSDHRLWRLDGGWPELFWRLVGRHGPWGLAYLEAVMRLADGSRSAEEQRAGGRG